MNPVMPLMRLIPLLILLLLSSLSPVQVSASSALDEQIRYLHIQKGQTLHNIVRRLYPERKAEWPKIRRQIISMNPHAFPTGEASSMRANVRIELPLKQVVKPTPAYRPAQVGKVIAQRGQTLAVGKNNVKRKLSVGNPVFVGDKLITGEDGFMRLKMVDQAQLDIRCFSIMVIEEYTLKPASRTSILNLLQGSLRKVTGEIGRLGEDIYELKTPVASVGVRGTEYALRVFQSRGCDGSVDTGEDAMYLEVIKGLVDVENKAAKTAVAKGDTVYIPLPDSAPVDKPLPEGALVLEKDARPEPEEEGASWWWLIGGLLLIAVL